MSFGERLKARRGELKLSRGELAERLGVSASAVSNYENGLSFPKEEVMLRLFDSLESGPEQMLLRQYRSLSPLGRETVHSVVEALCAYRRNETGEDAGKKSKRMIPLYRTPAAAGYAAPVFGEDFDYIPVTEEVPQAAEFALRISGDSMMPYIADGSVVYGTAVAADTGVRGNIVDLYYDTYQQCINFGRRTCNVYILE